MICVANLVKSFNGKRAVNDLSFEIEAGEILGLAGPNGAGKTTTIKIIAGLLTANSGNIIVNGVDITRNPMAIKERVGYMPDFFGVYDNLTALEYMDFYASAYFINKNKRSELINSLLKLVELTDFHDSYVNVLSRGMKQRLCLAKSLIHDPDILLLDEPASGLDPRSRIEIKEILKHLKNLGKTIIISSHILSDLSEICTKIGVVNRGRMLALGTINDIMRRMNKERIIYIKPLEMSENLILALRENPLVGKISENSDNIEISFEGDDRELTQLLKSLITRDIAISAFKEKEGNLEDIFMRLTEGGEPHA